MDTKKPNRMRTRAAIFVAIISPAILCWSCATYVPRYTLDSVRPPATLGESRVLLKEDQLLESDNVSITGTVVDDADSEVNLVMGFTLEEAIPMAIANNRSLEVQSFAPEIAETAIAEARAAFDPGLTFNLAYSEKATPGNEADTTSWSQTGTTSSDTELGQAITAIQGVVQQTGQLITLLQGETLTVNHARNLGADGRLAVLLPTGTSLYATGGVSRDNATGWEMPEYQGNWSVGVAQSLLRGFGSHVNLVTMRRARNDAAGSAMAFRNYVMQVVAQVESAYWELALAQETQRIRQFSLDLAQEQLKINEALIAVGKLPGSARFSAEAEVASQKAQLADADASLQSKAVDLWQLLNPGALTVESIQILTIEYPELSEPDLSIRESAALARVFRPDLAQARLDIANGDLAILQSQNGLLPDLTAFASYGLKSSGSGAAAWNRYLADSTFDQFQAGLEFNMTLGNRAEKARYKRAKLQVANAEAAVKALEQYIDAEIHKGIVEVERQAEQIEASRRELLSRTKELDVETEQFRLGRSTNLNVLLVQQKLVLAKLQEATSRIRYVQAITALYQAEGTLLVRRGIVMSDDKEYSQ